MKSAAPKVPSEPPSHCTRLLEAVPPPPPPSPSTWVFPIRVPSSSTSQMPDRLGVNVEYLDSRNPRNVDAAFELAEEFGRQLKRR